MVYPAHISYDLDGKKYVQTVAEHSRNCAYFAAARAGSQLEHTAYLAGLLHDMGKYTDAFRSYIEAAAAGQGVRRGSVNHTFAGVRFAWEHWHKRAFPGKLVCELVVVAAGAHHGLFDIIGESGYDGFLYRLQKEGIHDEAAREAFLERCAPEQELDRLFEAATEEVGALVSNCRGIAKTREEMEFYLSLLARFLLSAVIEGDRRDTADFQQGQINCFLWRDIPITRCGSRWSRCLEHVNRHLSEMDSAGTINQVRQEISDQCLQAASRPDGIYRLSLPTGSGKTLTSLRYALEVAKRGKQRIFFVIPLLSVLEQNAAAIREAVGDDELILEHHSNVVREKREQDELDPNELCMENWESPIVITTLVQLMDTLFSGKTSCIRRMSALRDSVLIVDEVQTVPRKMLTLFNLAMNFLAECLHTTVVLCSATQPALEQTEYPLCYASEPELVPRSPVQWQVFRRTKIYDLRTPSGYQKAQVADLVEECREKHGSVLLICNTKREAREVYRELTARNGESLFHLSTAMCMANRVDTLRQIQKSLDGDCRAVCVSTQLVEAGVDFSFGCVIRILAGLDNVVQSAGRCNRHGEKGHICPVYIINWHHEEDQLGHLPDIQAGQYACEDLLARFAANPMAYGEDLTSPQSIQRYYETLYGQMERKAADYPLPKKGTTMFQLLSSNSAFYQKSAGDDYVLHQAFDTAGKEFSVFEDLTTDVIVPYKEGEEVIADLHSRRAQRDVGFRKACIQRAKPYTVCLFDYEIRVLQSQGGLSGEDIFCMREGFYSREIGWFLGEKGGEGYFA